MTSSSIAKRRMPSDAGKRDEPRQQIGHLHARELRPSLVFDHDREILAAIRDERKRVAGVERQRRQHRADVDVEVPLEDTRGRRRCTRPGSSTTMPSSASCGRSVSCQKSDSSCEHRRGLVARARIGLVEAHHEELVEVVGGDAEKLDALEQRMAGPGLLQHPLVEGQPAELAVEVERRIPEIGIRRRCFGGLGGQHVGRDGPRSGSWPCPLPYQCQWRFAKVSCALMNALANFPSASAATPS